MSRTDKTAPYDVKVFFYSDWIEEYHDHTEGPCDLPPRPRNRKDDGFRWWKGGRAQRRCYWTPSYTQFWTHPLSHCPCYMCSYDAFEVPRNKRERRESKRYCRDGWRDEY